MTKQQVGEKIKARRKQLGLTQKQIAERLDIPVQGMPNIENGVTNITLTRLLELCSILDMELQLKNVSKTK